MSPVDMDLGGTITYEGMTPSEQPEDVSADNEWIYESMVPATIEDTITIGR